MALAVHSNRHLIDSHPQLRAAYFSDAPASIAPLSLHVALASTNYNDFTDVVLLGTFDLSTGNATATPAWLWSFPPFMACLVEGDATPWRSTRIDHWFERGTDHFCRKRGERMSVPGHREVAGS